MSEYYDISIEIRDYILENRFKIADACREESRIGGSAKLTLVLEECTQLAAQGYAIRATQRGMLVDETAGKFAERITHAVWEANGDFCEVSVTPRCRVPVNPYATVCLSRDDYSEYRGEGKSGAPYRVIWEIEIDNAASPREAAVKAREIQKNPDPFTTSTRFMVVSSGGPTEIIDFRGEEEENLRMRCRLCGEVVMGTQRREHLEQQHSSARGMSRAAVALTFAVVEDDESTA